METRTREFTRNADLEALMEQLSAILAGAEKRALRNFCKPSMPIILVHGCARSGTTLMMQLLARMGLFAYPSNLIARFYQAPYIGVLIQSMLTDPRYAFRDEFSELKNACPGFGSSLGKTAGILSPNEFYYFWRRFFDYGEIQYLEDEQLKRVNKRLLLAELAAIEAGFGKPLLLKGMMMNWNIEFLDALFDNVIFVYIKRNALFNAQSLLEARKSFYGNTSDWYSFKPPEYDLLKKKDPITQVLGQVITTNLAIECGLANVAPGRKLQVDYDSLCSAPAVVIHELLDLLSRQGYSCCHEGVDSLDSATESRNSIRMRDEEWQKMVKTHEALKARFYGETGLVE